MRCSIIQHTVQMEGVNDLYFNSLEGVLYFTASVVFFIRHGVITLIFSDLYCSLTFLAEFSETILPIMAKAVRLILIISISHFLTPAQAQYAKQRGLEAITEQAVMGQLEFLASDCNQLRIWKV